MEDIASERKSYSQKRQDADDDDGVGLTLHYVIPIATAMQQASERKSYSPKRQDASDNDDSVGLTLQYVIPIATSMQQFKQI